MLVFEKLEEMKCKPYDAVKAYRLTAFQIFVVSTNFPDALFYCDTNKGIREVSYILPPPLRYGDKIYEFHFRHEISPMKVAPETELFTLIIQK